MENAGKVTLDDVKKFHAQFYGASHGELVIVGQFDPAAVSKTAAELFGNWPSPAPYQRITQNFEKTAAGESEDRNAGQTKRDIRGGFAAAMADTDPDYPAMVLANYMFGGSITARVPDRIRNREGLSYSVNSNFRAPQPAEGNAARFGAAGHQQSQELAESGSEFPR